MSKVKIDAEYLNYETGKWITFVRNVIIEVDETSNKQMNRVFREQCPEFFEKIPVRTDERGFSFRAYFECTPTKWKR